MASYESYIRIGEVSAPWGTWGDEFLHRLEDGLASSGSGLSLAGHKFDSTTQPFIEVKANMPDGTPASSVLLVAPLIDGTAAVFVGQNEQNFELVETWARAVLHAASSLGKEGPLHEWTAIIGPPPVRIGGMEAFPAERGRIGPFEVVAVDKPIVEGSHNPEHPSLHSASIHAAILTTVRAKHRGYSWQAASKNAAQELNRLCGLLSVVWDSCLVIRESPAPLEWGERRPPDRIYWQDFGPAGDVEESTQVGTPKSLPEWIDGAWQRLVESRRLSDAVAAHHEGMRARFDAPQPIAGRLRRLHRGR